MHIQSERVRELSKKYKTLEEKKNGRNHYSKTEKRDNMHMAIGEKGQNHYNALSNLHS